MFITVNDRSGLEHTLNSDYIVDLIAGEKTGELHSQRCRVKLHDGTLVELEADEFTNLKASLFSKA